MSLAFFGCRFSWFGEVRSEPVVQEEPGMPQAADPDPWVKAAYDYSQFDASGRAAYWSQLDSGQQAALTSALRRMGTPAIAASIPGAKRGGLLSVASAGCLGVVLGAVLTVAIQVPFVVKEFRQLVWEMLLPSASTSPDKTPPDDAPVLDYLSSDCKGPPTSREEELFCQLWERVHPEP